MYQFLFIAYLFTSRGNSANLGFFSMRELVLLKDKLVNLAHVTAKRFIKDSKGNRRCGVGNYDKEE